MRQLEILARCSIQLNFFTVFQQCVILMINSMMNMNIRLGSIIYFRFISCAEILKIMSFYDDGMDEALYTKMHEVMKE